MEQIIEEEITDQLANLTDEQLEDYECVDTLWPSQIRNLTFDDWCELVCIVKRKKHQAEYEQQTAEKIVKAMPYFAQAAAKDAVDQLIRATMASCFYKRDNVANILMMMFSHCCITDIYVAVRKEIEREVSYGELLLGFIEELRKICWEHYGEILKLAENAVESGEPKTTNMIMIT